MRAAWLTMEVEERGVVEVGGGGGDQDHFFGHHGRERMVFDGKRMRKPIQRKTVDFNSTVIQHLKVPFYSL